MPSFEIESADLWGDGPLVEVSFGATTWAIEAEGGRVADPVKASAMVDTGASRTLVAHDLLGPLGLHPVGATSISTPSSREVPCAVYATRLTLPNSQFTDITVIQAPPDGLAGSSIDALIGRDVLRFAIFIYQGPTGRFTLAF